MFVDFSIFMVFLDRDIISKWLLRSAAAHSSFYVPPPLYSLGWIDLTWIQQILVCDWLDSARAMEISILIGLRRCQFLSRIVAYSFHLWLCSFLFLWYSTRNCWGFFFKSLKYRRLYSFFLFVCLFLWSSFLNCFWTSSISRTCSLTINHQGSL